MNEWVSTDIDKTNFYIKVVQMKREIYVDQVHIKYRQLILSAAIHGTRSVFHSLRLNHGFALGLSHSPWDLRWFVVRVRAERRPRKMRGWNRAGIIIARVSDMHACHVRD